jgi:hypothetical protein
MTASARLLKQIAHSGPASTAQLHKLSESRHALACTHVAEPSPSKISAAPARPTWAIKGQVYHAPPPRARTPGPLRLHGKPRPDG